MLYSFFISPIVGPIVEQTQITSTTPCVERLIPKNQLHSQTNQAQLPDLRGGGNQISEFIIRILLIWTMSQNSRPTVGFQPNPINLQNLGRHQWHDVPNPRIAPKLVENPLQRNNPGQGGVSCKTAKHTTSMDTMANSLTPEYLKFQNKYYSKSLGKRFDTTECPTSKFKQLAYDSIREKYTRTSIDEARAIVQAELKKLVIGPNRSNKLQAQLVDLDFTVQGPGQLTHVDIKNPVGSEILKKQGQNISIEEMGYQIGENIVDQKHYFIGREKGPVSPENVDHIVDLCYVPSNEKDIVKQKFLEEALDKVSNAGIIFLNDK